MKSFCDTVSRFIDAFLVVGGALVCSVVFANVAARYLLHFDLAWIDELGETLFVWLTFFGGARAVRLHAHLSVLEFVEHIPPRIGRVLFTALWLLTAAMLVGMIWFGIGIAAANMEQRMSVTGWPVGVVYLALPVGSLLALLFVVEQLLARQDFKHILASLHPEPQAGVHPISEE